MRQLMVACELHKNVITLGLIVDKVSKTASAPLIDLLDLAAVRGNECGELFNNILYSLVFKLGRDDVKGFILIHVFHLLLVFRPRTYLRGARRMLLSKSNALYHAQQ